jgi:VIT1/CCC1 family predicted Fe2+/Mn2+ transporter
MRVASPLVVPAQELTARLVRITRHVEPVGSLETIRHYVREIVYGASDGLITTFAVVAGVAGGGLSSTVILVCGIANLLADGLSMAVGNFQSIRAHESVLQAQGLPEEEAHPARHGLATFVAFVIAGAIPLLPVALGVDGADHLAWSGALTLASLFAVGAARSLISVERWWQSGLEMLLLGGLVAGVAYWSGALVAGLMLS